MNTKNSKKPNSPAPSVPSVNSASKALTSPQRSPATRRPSAKPRTAPARPEPATGLRPAVSETAACPTAETSMLPASTTVEAHFNVGPGNTLFIRGEGGGLSWDRGVPMTCREASVWTWTTPWIAGPLTFKLLVNDERWSAGDNLSLQGGQSIAVSPSF